MFGRSKRPEPELAPAPAPEPAWRRQVNNILETQVARYPFLVQVRALWRQLQDEREAWPVLIPLLLALFAGFYRAERARVRREIEELKAR